MPLAENITGEDDDLAAGDLARRADRLAPDAARWLTLLQVPVEADPVSHDGMLGGPAIARLVTMVRSVGWQMTIQVLSTGHRMFTCGNEHGDRFIYRFWSESAEDMRIENQWNTADALAPTERMKRSAEADAFAIEFGRREDWIKP